LTLLTFYLTQIKTTILELLQYRAALVIWILQFVPQPVISLVVWIVVARAQQGEIGGFSENDFIVYFTTVIFVRHIVFGWALTPFAQQVQSGRLSTQLLRPLHPIHARIAEIIGYKIISGVPVLMVVMGLFAAFRPAIPIVPWTFDDHPSFDPRLSPKIHGGLDPRAGCLLDDSH